MITLEQLKALMPNAGNKAEIFLPYLNSAMQEFEISTPERQAAFLAQVMHESENLSRLEENLNYRAETLMKVWPKRFPTLPIASQYAGKPQKIANTVYANRMGNLDVESGDGWKYRGAGLIELTGKDTHFACALYFNIDPTNISDWLRTPEGACRSAAWFWSKASCNKYADVGDFDGVSDVINIGKKTDKVGDSIGYTQRVDLYNRLKKILGVK